MAYAVYSLGAGDSLFYDSTPTRLILTNVLLSSGVAVSGNKFTVNQVGDYRVDVSLNIYGLQGPKDFTIELYDETAGTALAKKDGTASASAGGEMVVCSFALTIAAIANEYSVRVYGRGPVQAAQKLVHVSYGSIVVAPFTASGSAGVVFNSIDENVTLANAAFTDSTANLLPANCFVMGIVFRVATLLPNGRTWKAGTSVTDDLFVPLGASGALATAKSTLDTAAGPLSPFANGAAGKVRLTPSNADAAGGVIKVVTRYFTLAPA
jgi:hypothetical protein